MTSITQQNVHEFSLVHDPPLPQNTIIKKDLVSNPAWWEAWLTIVSGFLGFRLVFVPDGWNQCQGVARLQLIFEPDELIISSAWVSAYARISPPLIPTLKNFASSG